ncbi:MAG: calx-beta domain protein, partial [Gomphosphaeria aponina SAG 52.96 = DSM 107014]|nr:calx-beta domain protein [Gomphosphaeria aponina SAG 52.96 = DSM 107014]
AGDDTVNSNITITTLAANVENINLQGTANINATGNTLNNNLTGNSGNNILNGGAGNDKMAGGAGNDIYIVGQSGDVVLEESKAGNDLIKSSQDYTIGENQERLTLTGKANLKGTGNETNNTITGNSGNNELVGNGGNDILTGGAGNDNLVGGAGNDILTGGAGVDKFVFNALAEKIDTLKDFLPGTDKICINKIGFSELLQPGVLPSDQFVLGTAPLDSNDYFIYNAINGQVSFDADGVGTAQSTHVLATLTGVSALSANDIIIF